LGLHGNWTREWKNYTTRLLHVVIVLNVEETLVWVRKKRDGMVNTNEVYRYITDNMDYYHIEFWYNII